MKDQQWHCRWRRCQPWLSRVARLSVQRGAAWLGEESAISGGGGAQAQVKERRGQGESRGWVEDWSERWRCHQRVRRSWGGISTNWSVFDFDFKRGGAWVRMPEKGAWLDWPDLAVLPPSRALGQVRRIGPAKDSIIVGPGCWGRRHWVHLPPILGSQWCGTHHGGAPRQHGGVQPPLEGHTHQGEEGNKQNNSYRVCVLFILFILTSLACLKIP